MGLDTVSGLLRIVVNGKVVVDEEKQYFKDTSAWKPKSVAGHLLGSIVQPHQDYFVSSLVFSVFKGYIGFWYQFRNTFPNLNIFSSMMSVEDMVTRTAGGQGCDSPGDYLRCDK